MKARGVNEVDVEEEGVTGSTSQYPQGYYRALRVNAH